MDAIILPLHGSFPPQMQVPVFSPPPPNCRRFIVATNIAETSLRVDGVVCVIDSGYVSKGNTTHRWECTLLTLSRLAKCKLISVQGELEELVLESVTGCTPRIFTMRILPKSRSPRYSVLLLLEVCFS